MTGEIGMRAEGRSGGPDESLGATPNPPESPPVDARPPVPEPARPVEVELKYRVRDLVAGERYLIVDEIAGFVPAAPTHTVQLEDHYVDTADRALARAGFAGRLRYGPGTTIVTIKSTANREPGVAGLHRRDELEGQADRALRPRDWPASDARSLILELCGDGPLVELVTVRQLRRTRVLRSGGTLVELSLDEVDVLARSTVVERFHELEVELARGDELRLRDLAAVLGADPALTPASTSKFEAALRAVTAAERPGKTRNMERHGDDRPSIRSLGHPRTVSEAAPTEGAEATEGAAAPPAVGAPRVEPSTVSAATDGDTAGPGQPGSGARPDLTGDAGVGGPAQGGDGGPLPVGRTPGVIGDDSVAEAGRKVLRFHLARMLARDAGARDGRDPEDVHAMRVATRRMRAAWRVFGDGFRPARTRRYRRRLRDLAARLGAVRDLDVLLEAATAYQDALPDGERVAFEPLLEAWRTFRDDARVLLLHELDAPGYARFVEDYRVFVQAEGAAVRPIAPNQPHRIRDTMPARAWTAYEQVRAYEPVLRWATVETLHELRIAAKWLRYTLEFVREPLGPEVNPLIASVTELQDHLGRLHDADVAASMTRAFLVEHASTLDAAETAAIGRYLVSRERTVAQLHRGVSGPWRAVAGLSFRQALGRVVAGL